MQVQGRLVYNPVARATGKDRARIIRRNAHELHALCRLYVPWLQNKQRRVANQLDQLLSDDPNYWVRRKGQVSSPEKLNQLLDHARWIYDNVGNWQFIPGLPDWTKRLGRLITIVEEDLIITRRDHWWAILELKFSVVEPFLQQIRADGTHIGASVWGPHISIIRGERPRQNMDEWKSQEGRTFTVEVNGEIVRSRRGYYWLKASSPELEDLRTNLGLPPRPRPPFHLTIGKSS